MSARWTVQEYNAYCKRRRILPNASVSTKRDGVSQKRYGEPHLPDVRLYLRQKQLANLTEGGELALPHTICLPLPPRKLWPNGRPGHMEKARIKAAHKAECLQVLAYEAFPGLKLSTIDRALIVDLRFVFTPRHRTQMDKDNIIAACKTSLDSLTGIVWVDDKQVDIGSATQIVEREPGLLEWLEITIREAV